MKKNEKIQLINDGGAKEIELLIAHLKSELIKLNGGDLLTIDYLKDNHYIGQDIIHGNINYVLFNNTNDGIINTVIHNVKSGLFWIRLYEGYNIKILTVTDLKEFYRLIRYLPIK